MDYINQGLSNEEVEIRINNNQVNYDTSIKTKSIPKIIFYNIFTLFNMLNLILAYFFSGFIQEFIIFRSSYL